MRSQQITQRVVMAVVVAFLLSAAGSAQAAIPDASGVYTACYDKVFQRMRMIDADAGQTCKNFEILITWSQAGPLGPAGPPGPAGSPGPKGDKGDPGDALKADGPCFNDNENRYQDCGNGTVTDTVTGLIWLKQPSCFDFANWADANTVAATLEQGQCGLMDNSSPGDWRLPTKDEWEATIRQANALSCDDPSLTNSVGNACYYTGGPSDYPFGVLGPLAGGNFWASSTAPGTVGNAAICGLEFGLVGERLKSNLARVWPVRSGR